MNRNGKINRVTIHITATPATTTVDQIRRAHKSQGWSDIGYHWLVDSKGVIHSGRNEMFVGSHVGGANTNNIGISYIARGSDVDNKANPYYKYMTEAQRKGLIEITADVLKRYGLTTKELYGHNDFTNRKACPCFQVRNSEFAEDVNKAMKEPLQNEIAYELREPMMYSKELEDIQRGLMLTGFYDFAITGYFGKRTELAVRGFQEANGLEVTGKIETELLEKYKSIWGK